MNGKSFDLIYSVGKDTLRYIPSRIFPAIFGRFFSRVLFIEFMKYRMPIGPH
jgi:hypothetical protein